MPNGTKGNLNSKHVNVDSSGVVCKFLSAADTWSAETQLNDIRLQSRKTYLGEAITDAGLGSVKLLNSRYANQYP